MNGYPNPRGQYFKELCDRLFDYQEENGLIEPHTDHIVSLLVESPEVTAVLSSNGINVMLDANQLSAVFKHSVTDVNDIDSRKAVFDDYIQSPASEKLLGIVESALIKMEEGRIVINDTNLLRTIMQSPDFHETCHASALTFEIHGITPEDLDEDNQARPAPRFIGWSPF